MTKGRTLSGAIGPWEWYRQTCEAGHEGLGARVLLVSEATTSVTVGRRQRVRGQSDTAKLRSEREQVLL